MSDLEEMIVDGFDTGTRVARHSQICRGLVARFSEMDAKESALVAAWDRELLEFKRDEFVKIFWERAKAADEVASSRAWLFYGLIQEDTMVNGFAAGLLIMFALKAGLDESDIAHAFGIIH